MLRKKEAYTVCTPIPGFIPRQLALDILHSHSEIITLNPLVLDVKPISAPRNAAADEYYSTWYEITERVQVMPGIGKLGGTKITFNGCFHDMPWGVQSHVYAPLGIDLRNRYRIAGNQPGLEPPEHRELGLEQLGAPKDGLYLREDIEIRANISIVSFVKAQLKASSKEMVDRMIRKAELLDKGVLKAMMAPDGRLKTINPNDRSNTTNLGSPGAPPPGFGASPQFQQARPASSHTPLSHPGSPQPYQTSFTPPPIPPKEQEATSHTMELPGDYKYYHQLQQPQQPQQCSGLQPQYTGTYPQQQYGQQPQQHSPHSHYSPGSTSDPRWSPNSQAGTPAQGHHYQGQYPQHPQQPPQPQQSFIAEMAANEVPTYTQR